MDSLFRCDKILKRGQSRIDKARNIPDLLVTMKPLLASLAILFAVNMSAQPYNPDANGDGVLSASDLLPFLGGFGQPFTVVDSTCVTVHQLPSPPCDGWCWWEVPVCDFIIFETPNRFQSSAGKGHDGPDIGAGVVVAGIERGTFSSHRLGNYFFSSCALT